LISEDQPVRAVTLADFAALKTSGTKIVMVTAYDALFGRLVDEAGVDAVLVGDSVATAVFGHQSTLPVTLDQMIYHAAAVRRGVKRAVIVIDMPFLTYQASVELAILNCGRAVQETGAAAVKVEGGGSEMIATVHALIRTGIPVMGHVGFTPQSVKTIGGARVQGRQPADAERLITEAKALEDAGAFAVVLELVPAEVAARITGALRIPTIGIGAGPDCDGQVLVLPDLLGLNDTFAPKFLKRYAELAQDVKTAVRTFGEDVRAGNYPGPEHSF
jgi:3-methyl-2-oxobutanoate hydroxymethyltransferase